MNDVSLKINKNLVKQFSPNNKIQYSGDIEFYYGDVIAIVGPSGQGKSTLLNLMAGLSNPNSGKIWAVIDQTKFNVSDSDVKQHFGFVFQEALLFPRLTCMENALLHLSLNENISKAQVNQLQQQAKNYYQKLFSLDEFPESQTKSNSQNKTKNIVWLNKLSTSIGSWLPQSRLNQIVNADLKSCSPIANKFPHQISGGQRRRVAIIRALLNDPNILFADEPTSGLDHKMGIDVMKALHQWTKEKHQKRCLVFVTHDEKLATIFSNKMYRLNRQSQDENSSVQLIDESHKCRQNSKKSKLTRKAKS